MSNGSGFDIDFKLLPPKLQVQLWVLALDADTSKVNLAYKSGAFKSAVGYNYGGNLQASMGIRRFSTKLQVHPGDGNVKLDLGLAFKGFKFGLSGSPTKKSVGGSIGYGAKLLPFPQELSSTFNAAGTGIGSMAGNIRAAPDNPLAWYKLHSNDVAAISSAVAAGRQIAAHGKSKRFGAGLRLNYSAESGFVIYGGAQYRF